MAANWKEMLIDSKETPRPPAWVKDRRKMADEVSVRERRSVKRDKPLVANGSSGSGDVHVAQDPSEGDRGCVCYGNFVQFCA